MPGSKGPLVEPVPPRSARRGLWGMSKLDEIKERANPYDKDVKWLLDTCQKLLEKLAVLRRYHGGDGSVTREQVFEALAETEC